MTAVDGTLRASSAEGEEHSPQDERGDHDGGDDGDPHEPDLPG